MNICFTVDCVGPKSVNKFQIITYVFIQCYLRHFICIWLFPYNWQYFFCQIQSHPFIHSFIQAISIAPLQVLYYSEALLTQHGYCARISRRSFTGNCGLAQGPYVAARAEVEPTTLWTKGVDCTKVPHTPHIYSITAKEL